jgi:uncharacterized membrane protein
MSKYKIISYIVVPLITLALFITIGIIVTHNLYTGINHPMHFAMSSDLYLYIWIGRGIYAMLLIWSLLFVLYSKKTKFRKFLIILLLMLFNIPIICYIYMIIPLPEFAIIIPVVNIIAFIPFYFKRKHRNDFNWK